MKNGKIYEKFMKKLFFKKGSSFYFFFKILFVKVVNVWKLESFESFLLYFLCINFISNL